MFYLWGKYCRTGTRLFRISFVYTNYVLSGQLIIQWQQLIVHVAIINIT